MVQTRTIQNSNVSFLAQSTASGLTAASAGTRAGALALDAAVNQVTTAVAGASVALPAAVGQAGAYNLKGASVRVINATAVQIVVFTAPGSSDTINGAASTVGFPLPAGASASFTTATGYPESLVGTWVTDDAAGSGGPLDGAALQIVNAAGTNQQSVATAVVPGNVIVAVVSLTTRGIRLSSPGTNKSYVVFNDAATTLSVYPATNVSIAGSATNAKVSIAAHKGEIFLYRNQTHIVIMGAGGV